MFLISMTRCAVLFDNEIPYVKEHDMIWINSDLVKTLERFRGVATDITLIDNTTIRVVEDIDKFILKMHS